MVAMRKYVLALVVPLLLVFGACDSGKPGGAADSFRLTDVTGAGFGRDFQLVDHDGKLRSLGDFKGKVVVMFFGYTHCPDVCPTTLSELATVARELGPDAGKLQVLFVTVDPERDTPALLKQYVPAFNPSFLGLRGDAEATLKVAKEFKIFYQKQQTPGGGYTMDHSAGTYIFDREGRLRLFGQYGAGAPALLHDIRMLVGS